jgi:hypothetical protein
VACWVGCWGGVLVGESLVGARAGASPGAGAGSVHLQEVVASLFCPTGPNTAPAHSCSSPEPLTATARLPCPAPQTDDEVKAVVNEVHLAGKQQRAAEMGLGGGEEDDYLTSQDLADA